MFYLTKFRFMHKHDNLSLSPSVYQTLAIKKNKKQNINKPSSLVQNNENDKDEKSTALL